MTMLVSRLCYLIDISLYTYIYICVAYTLITLIGLINRYLTHVTGPQRQGECVRLETRLKGKEMKRKEKMGVLLTR